MLDAKKEYLEKEKLYEQLDRLAPLLHVPIPRTFITLEVFDKDRKLIQRHHQRSHSWTRNAYNHLFSALAAKNGSDAIFGAGKINFKDKTGIVRNGAVPISHSRSANIDTPNADDGTLTPAANVDKGILVGSGTNAEDFEDYVLQTPIAEGTGAGELNAIASENHSMSYAALVLKDDQVRYFNNNSGGNVDINEVALVDGIIFEMGVKYDVLIARDKLGATVTVPDTGQCKVTYTIQLTYPE